MNTNTSISKKEISPIGGLKKENQRDFVINAYLSPHPLGEDTFLEEEWISWIPGYVKEETEEEIPSYYHESNIALYDKIEKLTEELFQNAVNRLWPLLKDHHFKSFNIAIDYANYGNSKSSLAGYEFKHSMPGKGEYYFSVTPSLLKKYASFANLNTDLVPNLGIWEHELIHLLDHWDIVKASSLASSDIPINNLQYYLLKYREEGIANLFDLLDGNIKSISCIKEAKEIFQRNYAKTKERLLILDRTNSQVREDVYSGYDFYEVGPWLILDMLKEIPMVTDLIEIETLEQNIANGIVIDDQLKMQIIRNAFYIDIEYFNSRYRIG